MLKDFLKGQRLRVGDGQKIQYDKIGIYKVKSIICVFMSVIIKSEAVRC